MASERSNLKTNYRLDENRTVSSNISIHSLSFGTFCLFILMHFRASVANCQHIINSKF